MLSRPHTGLRAGTYDIAWRSSGRYGYTREYLLYNNAPGHATRVDPSAMVHVRQEPDTAGNVNSPLATVYEQGVTARVAAGAVLAPHRPPRSLSLSRAQDRS